MIQVLVSEGEIETFEDPASHSRKLVKHRSMSIEPYHLGRYSSIGSRPDVPGAEPESHDLLNHRGDGPFRDFTLQWPCDEPNYAILSPLCFGETEMAVDVDGNDRIETSGNVNEKNLEDDNDQRPRMGMRFSSESEAGEFYKKYAEKIGFTVRKGKVQRNSNGAVTWRIFLCSCEGFRKDSNSEGKRKYQKPETRTGCLANIQVKLEIGHWVITNLHLKHNHRLQCLDTVSGPSLELEDAFGADNQEIQTSLDPTEAEVRDETLADPNIVAGVLDMVEEPGVISDARESIWQQILAKYGDVTANCSFSEPAIRARFVEISKEVILKIVELMQKKTAYSLSKADVCYIDRALSDLERGNIEVVWLRRIFVLVEYAQEEGKREMIRRRLNEKINEVEQLYEELDQVEASLQELQRRIPDSLRIEDALGEGLL